MSDLVERLLAAIQEREDKARAATQGEWRWRDAGREFKWALCAMPPGCHWPGQIVVPSGLPDAFPLAADGDHIEANDPESVLRLCQAHRKIIDQYQVRKALPDELMADRVHGSYVLEAKAVVRAMELVIVALAEGYGIEAES